MFEAIVIGASAGGMEALGIIVSELNKTLLPPIIIIQHISADSDNYLIKYLAERTTLVVKEVENDEVIKRGTIYVAPPNYHILVENTKTFRLSVEAKVLFSRPSIDVTFFTAAEAYRRNLVGIVLTGASSDGSLGLKRIKELGGFGIVQNPATADVVIMPSSAIKTANPDMIMTLEEIGIWINKC